MNRRPKNTTKDRRRGAIAVLSATMMLVLMSMLAFCIDLGYVANSQAELQRSADAAALAACYKLMYKGTPSKEIDLSGNIAAVPGVAREFAGRNTVCKSSPALSNTDVVVGRISNPLQWGGTISKSGEEDRYNAVQVTVQRTSQVNGMVPTFFGRVLGINGNPITATATAAFVGQMKGFTTSSSSDGTRNVPILPFTLDCETWEDFCENKSHFRDDWCCSAQEGVSCDASGLTSGQRDGRYELNLFPQPGVPSAGNRGTVNIGANPNSTATIVRQILYGCNETDLSYYPNKTIAFASDGKLRLPGDPGISAGFADALRQIRGQLRLIPIFCEVTGNGDTCTYVNTAFLGVRICDVNLTGSLTSKHLTVQPEFFIVRGGVPATESSSETTFGAYSPVFLVK